MMMGPRKWKEYTVLTRESHKIIGAGGAGFFLKSPTNLQVVLIAPGHQMVNLPRVGRLIPKDGSVIHKVSFRSLMDC